MKLTEFCIKRPVFTVVLSLVIVVLGVIGFIRVPLRGYPNINPPVISVNTTYPGASASVVESQITTPIENQLAGISGLENMHSRSEHARSHITLHFRLGTDVNVAFSDVQNLLAHVIKKLPQDAQPPVIQKRDPNQEETLVLALTDHKLSGMALTDYANRYLVPRLQEVSGVAAVDVFNQRLYAMRINLNPIKMAADGVTVTDMSKVLAAQNVDVPTGEIKTPDRYYSVISRGQLGSVDAFKNLIIRDQNGFLLRFKDVAHVAIGPADTDSAMFINGKEAVGLGVYAQSTANPLTVVQQVKKDLDKLKRDFPSGMKVKVVWDNTLYLKATLDEVYRDLAFAMLLVVIVIVLFLGSFRSALIPLITIPICLIGVCAMLYLLGYSINIFTLLALVLAIGLVVDDAIVMLENIYRHIEKNMEPMQAAIKGSGQIAFAIIAMTITLAAVYAPIGFARGMTGIIFREFAFTLAIAVLLSGFVALTLSPMMCARMLRLPEKDKGLTVRFQAGLDHFFEKLKLGYQNLLSKVLRHRIWVVLLLIMLMALGGFVFHRLPSELSPKEDMGGFFVMVTPPANASFSYTEKYAKQVGALMQKLPGVEDVYLNINPEFGAFSIATLAPWSKRKESVQQLMSQLNKEVQNISGVVVNAFNMSQIGGGGKYGNSLRLVLMTDQGFDDLFKTSNNFMHLMRDYDGFESVNSDLVMNDKQYVIKVNRNLAAALQVNVADITDTLKTMLGGSTVTQFTWNNRNYDVIMQIAQHSLDDLQIINQLYVRNAAGKMIPLSSLAHVTQEVGPKELPHDNRLRANTITASLAPGVSMGQAVKYVKQLAKKNLPQGYQVQFRGTASSMLKSRGTMIGSFVLALIFIYLVMAAQFESFIDPFIILFTVPLSIVGALITLKLLGLSLSIYTNIGFVTLIGLIAKHGILITEFANQKRSHGVPFEAALLEAATQRLRPILMTTAAMVIGALPLAFASGAGALSRQHIGWVIVGGLLFGTFFSLIVVPVAYSFFSRKQVI